MATSKRCLESPTEAGAETVPKRSFDGGVVKNRRLFSESSEIADRYIEILTLTHRIKEKLLNLYFL
ncbi:MAG: hypothetical protein U0L88_01690 [Acutalibacteraceae bacterium]|nr:hypothetical protein [Acutalibacteraceae bacterium]